MTPKDPELGRYGDFAVWVWIPYERGVAGTRRWQLVGRYPTNQDSWDAVKELRAKGEFADHSVWPRKPPLPKRPLPTGDKARMIAQGLCDYLNSQRPSRVGEGPVFDWLARHYPEEFHCDGDWRPYEELKLYWGPEHFINTRAFMFWLYSLGITFRDPFHLYGLRKGWQQAFEEADWSQPPAPRF